MSIALEEVITHVEIMTGIAESIYADVQELTDSLPFEMEVVTRVELSSTPTLDVAYDQLARAKSLMNQAKLILANGAYPRYPQALKRFDRDDAKMNKLQNPTYGKVLLSKVGLLDGTIDHIRKKYVPETPTIAPELHEKYVTFLSTCQEMHYLCEKAYRHLPKSSKPVESYNLRDVWFDDDFAARLIDGVVECLWDAVSALLEAVANTGTIAKMVLSQESIGKSQ